MTWAEFEGTTLAEFEALEWRRATAIRYDRFNAALVTSTLLNANRDTTSEPIHPFDFLPGMEEDEEEKEREKFRKSAKKAVVSAFVGMRGSTAEEVQNAKKHIIVNLRESGIEDPEELIREVFPTI